MTEEQEVSRRYRGLPPEEPPRHVDDAILSAARRAVRSRPAPLVVPSGRSRWYFPLAAAAVIVLAVAVTVHVQREQPDPEAQVMTQQGPLTRDGPAEMPAAAPEVKPAPQPAPARKPQGFAPDPERREAEKAAAASRARVEEYARASESAPAPAPSAAPPPQAAADAASMDAAAAAAIMGARAKAQAEEAPRPQAAPAAPAAVAAKPAPVQRRDEGARMSSPASATFTPHSPEQWLQGIADLRRQGRHDEADKALADFRRRYPGYRISEAMLEKVEKR